MTDRGAGPPSPRRILLATDGSSDARAAAAWLTRWPPSERSRVRIVSVIERRLDWPGVQAYYDAVAADGHRILDEARASLSPVAAIETALLEGTPGDEIVREAHDWDADLVVVGARGLGLVDTWLLGSVSLTVARRVDCAVLVVKGDRRRLANVVVGLDGSGQSLDAGRFVAAWPLDARHSVRLIGVVEPVHFPSSTPSVIREQIVSAVREVKEERRAELTKALDQLARLFEGHGVTVSRVTPDGHPAEVIGAVAAEPDTDLVVVGARGLGGVKRLLLGSVSENVLRAARCPVLIVKKPLTS
ncbi:MAG TPA: universal stress protein [Candidatus Acidoferrum sp.]|nr:universal stress protein [Candidatus Acidoferrum sp.]